MAVKAESDWLIEGFGVARDEIYELISSGTDKTDDQDLEGQYMSNITMLEIKLNTAEQKLLRLQKKLIAEEQKLIQLQQRRRAGYSADLKISADI